jgi:hypothetical protein
MTGTSAAAHAASALIPHPAMQSWRCRKEIFFMLWTLGCWKLE